MKNVCFATGLCLLLFTSCKKDSTDNGSATSGTTALLASGTWKISYYFDTDHEETGDFSGYNFSFQNSNVVTAVKAATTVSGNWSLGTDDSRSKFILAFTSPAGFTELSDDWEIVSSTSTELQLKDVSGGNGGTDYLTFQKN